MKCKYCETETEIDYPFWKCPKCGVWWKFIGIDERGAIFQPYKATEIEDTESTHRNKNVDFEYITYQDFKEEEEWKDSSI